LPIVRPVAFSCEPEPELAFFAPPLLEAQVTLYPVIAEPPSKNGGEIDTTICPALAMMPAIRGAPGGPLVVAAIDTPDAGPTLKAFFATALHVYIFAGLSPVIVNGDAVPDTVFFPPPLLEMHVTTYPRTGAPPSDNGGANATTNRPTPLVSPVIKGA
jgi:hypothetical protein